MALKQTLSFSKTGSFEVILSYIVHVDQQQMFPNDWIFSGSSLGQDLFVNRMNDGSRKSIVSASGGEIKILQIYC